MVHIYIIIDNYTQVLLKINLKNDYLLRNGYFFEQAAMSARISQLVEKLLVLTSFHPSIFIIYQMKILSKNN